MEVKKMKKYNLGNGHEITVEKTNRMDNDYKICFYEDGRKLGEEYGDKEYIEYEYEIEL
jgi:hypothetical protein